MGLSSGGYHAIEAGLRLHPLGVCAINPGLTGWVPDVDQGVIDRRRQAYRPMPGFLRDLSVKHSRLALRAWRALCQVWVKGSPIHPVAAVSRRGIPVLVIASEVDAQEFEPSLYWSVVRRRLRRRGLLVIEVIPGDDHSLYTIDGQARGYPLLTRWVVDRFAPDTLGHRRLTGGERPPVRSTSAKPRSICSKMMRPTDEDRRRGRRRTATISHGSGPAGARTTTGTPGGSRSAG